MKCLIPVIALAVFFLFPIEEPKIDLNKILEEPNRENIFGTDHLGRDLLLRILHALRLDLMLSAIVVVLSSIIGILMGILSGYFQKIDKLVIFITDLFLALPDLVFALVLVGVIGPGIMNAVIVLTVFGWMRYSRAVRSLVLSLKESGFVEVSKAIGAPDSWIMFRHILPNVLPKIIPLFTYHFGHAIISFTALSFLGFGAQPGTDELGTMLNEGKYYMFSDPWLVVFPASTIIAIVMALTFFGYKIEFKLRRDVRWRGF